jgi:hypothetical protein
MRNDPNSEDLDNVSPARRHFLHVVSAAAGVSVLPALSNKAKACCGWPVPLAPPGKGGPSCFLRGTRILTSHGTKRVESLSI